MTRYIACRTCGKYLSARDAVARGYCSEDCARAFSACVTCGKYFLKSRGFDSEHCSKDCTVRYRILRKYGPQPVTVVTEV